MILRLTVLLLSIATLAAAPATRRAVGQVLGTTIYARDIGITEPVPPDIQFDARDDKRWKQMDEVSRAFGGPIIERFKKENDVRATAEERRKFGAFMHASQLKRLPKIQKQIDELQEKLASKTIADEKRAELEKDLAIRKRDLNHTREKIKDGPDDWARGSDHFIEPWKFQRNLQRKYGGRIIFQQFGPEALDGMRRLFEDAEKAGDLRIDDPGVRHLFYYYYNMPHTDAGDDSALENPWFLHDPTTQPAE